MTSEDLQECLVAKCKAKAAEMITVDIKGLLVDFAICDRHLIQVRRGDMVTESADPTRGLIGLGEKGDET
ncbi:hypothetical protein [Subtercola vilae]|uniref:Uncharacterized protein n=1 Tax=Subtercola vilae TaxID=2056433 RepID=A0A4T2B8C1_9MICO|nr:hypothetical protein [Subtercola vilae]TIH27077.1 hypothetical protein D4765_18625 [Subtercola vilae]